MSLAGHLRYSVELRVRNEELRINFASPAVNSSFLTLNLNKRLLSCIAIPEFFGGTAILILKNPVEIRQIVESAVVSNFRNRMSCVDQQAGRMTQSYFIQAFYKSFSGSFLYKTTKRHF